MSQRKLIITAPIMTGDIPHVAGALALDDTTDVLVVLEAKIGVDKSLLDFYEQAARNKAGRVKSYRSPALDYDPPNKSAAHHLYSKLKGKEKPEYLENLVHDVNDFVKKYLKYDVGSKDYEVISVSGATEVIAEHFRDSADKRVVHERFIEAAAYTGEFSGQLLQKMKDKAAFHILPEPNPNLRILLLWARYSGQKEGGYNPAGDSHGPDQERLSNLAEAQGYTVVRIGHSPFPGHPQEPVTKDCHLHEFYMDPLIEDRGRAGQVSFFVALKAYYSGRIIQMGQKTGGMDTAALVGIPTLYIEDEKSPSKSRMSMWTQLNNVPTLPFYRGAIISQPPTSLGKAVRILEAASAGLKTFRIPKNIVRTVPWVFVFRTELTGVMEAVADGQNPKDNGIGSGDGPIPKASFETITNMVRNPQQGQVEGWMEEIDALGDAGLALFGVTVGYLAEDMVVIHESLKSLTKELVDNKIL